MANLRKKCPTILNFFFDARKLWKRKKWLIQEMERKMFGDCLGENVVYSYLVKCLRWFWCGDILNISNFADYVISSKWWQDTKAQKNGAHEKHKTLKIIVAKKSCKFFSIVIVWFCSNCLFFCLFKCFGPFLLPILIICLFLR